jgi:hypothetical protein
MYSDNIHIAIEALLKVLKRDYAHQDIYPKTAIVEMLASMKMAQMCSDSRDITGKMFSPAISGDLLAYEEWEPLAKSFCNNWAEREYQKRMES